MGALICVISEDLNKKFKLKIEVNDGIKVASLGGENKIKVIGLISNTFIAVQNLHTSELLYIIGETELVIILKTDWMDHYQADIRRSDNIIEVQINDEKVRIRFQY